MFLLDEFERKSPHYQRKAKFYHSDTSNDYVDSVIEKEAQAIEAEQRLRYLEDLTDYDKKEIRSSMEVSQQEAYEHYHDKLKKYNPAPEEEPEPSISEDWSGDPLTVGLKAIKTTAKMVAENEDKISQVLPSMRGVSGLAEGVSKLAGMELDLYKGVKKSVAKGIAAIPKLAEEALSYFNADSETLESFNESVTSHINEEFASSGEGTYTYLNEDNKKVSIDIPHMTGEMVGHFVLPLSAASKVYNVTKGMNALSRVSAAIATDGAISGLLTTKETGTLANYIWDKSESDQAKIPLLGISLKMVHVDEDDHAFEARMKGALEGVLTTGSIATLAKGIKSVSSGIKGFRDFSVLKHINEKPHITKDYVSTTEKMAFDEGNFKNYVFKDYMKDGLNKAYNKVFFKDIPAFMADETGSIFNSGTAKTNKAFEEVIDSLKKNLNDNNIKLKKLSEKRKGEGVSKAIVNTEKEISDIKAATNEVNEFNKIVTKGIKEGDLSEANAAYKKLVANPSINKHVQKNLEESLSFFDEHVEFFKSMKNRDLSLYNTMKSIVNNTDTKAIDPKNIDDSNFLSAMNTPASTYEDLHHHVKNNGFASDKIQEYKNKFFGSTSGKHTEAGLRKAIEDYVSVHGGSYEEVSKFIKEGKLTAVEGMAIRDYLLEKGMTDFFEKGQKLAEFMASGAKNSKREAQMQVLSFAEAFSGMAKLSRDSKQAASDAGRMLNMQKKNVKFRLFRDITSKELNIKNFFNDEVSERFMEKLLHSNPGELKRISNKVNDIYKLIKEKKITSNQAMRMLAKSETIHKGLNNLSQYAYNNMLWGPTTLLKNVSGLVVNTALDAFQNQMIKTFAKKSYYEANGIDDGTFRQLVGVINRMDSEIDTTLNLISSSKRLSGLVDPSGNVKSWNKVLSDSFYHGKSMVDPGSEKFGVGYTSFNDTEKIIIKEWDNWFGNKGASDDLSRSYFNTSILEDANKVENSLPTKIIGGLHSFPLRALNATDDVAKSRIVKSRMLLFAKQAVNKKIARMSDASLRSYKGKNQNAFYKNYLKDVKREMDNVDNFDRAMGDARELTLTKQYGLTAEDYKFGPMPFSQWTNAVQKVPVLKFFYPFARMSINMSDYLTQYLPGMNILNNKIRADWAAGGYRAGQVITKSLVGAGISGAAWMMARNNMITGKMPTDRLGRQQWKESEIQEYSVNFGSFTVPLDLSDPFGKYLGLIADIHSSYARHFNSEDESTVESISRVALEAALGVAHLASPETLAETVSMANRITNSDHGWAGSTAYELSRKAGTLATKAIPMSAFLRFVNRPEEMQSTFVYNKDGVDAIDTAWNTFKKAWPPTMETTDIKNMFNDNVYYHNFPKELMGEANSQDFIDNIMTFATHLTKSKFKREEPIYTKLRDLSLNLPKMLYKEDYENRTLALPKLNRTQQLANEYVTLDNHQYNELIGYTNGYRPNGKKFMRPMKEYLNELVQKSWFNKKPELMQSLIIRDVVKKYQSYGRKMFKANNKQFRDDIIEKKKNRVGLEQ